MSYRFISLIFFCFSIVFTNTLNAEYASQIPIAALDFESKPKGCSFEKTGNITLFNNKNGKAVFLKDQNSIKIDISVGVPTNAGTISFWIRPDWSGKQHSDYAYIFSACDDTADVKKKCMSVTMGKKGGKDLIAAGMLRWNIYGDSSQRFTIFTDVSDWQKGQWHHLAFVWTGFNEDTSNAAATIFVDGKNVGDAPIKVKNNAMQFHVESFGSTLVLGVDKSCNFKQRGPNVAFDDLSIYNYALSVPQICLLTDRCQQKTKPTLYDDTTFAEVIPDTQCKWSATMSHQFFPVENLNDSDGLVFGKNRGFWSSSSRKVNECRDSQNPVTLTCDLGRNELVNNIFMVARLTASGKVPDGFGPRRFNLFVSEDNKIYALAGEFEMPSRAASGGEVSTEHFYFPLKQARFVKLDILSSWDEVADSVQIDQIRIGRAHLELEDIKVTASSCGDDVCQACVRIPVANPFSTDRTAQVTLKVLVPTETKDIAVSHNRQIFEHIRTITIPQSGKTALDLDVNLPVSLDAMALFTTCLIDLDTGRKVGQKHMEFNYGTNEITRILTDKVTYRSLEPTVNVTVVLDDSYNPEPDSKLSVQIVDPLNAKVLGSSVLALDSEASEKGIEASFALKLTQMSGLLAKATVHRKGRTIGYGERPFDITDDITRNWRWGQNSEAPFIGYNYKISKAFVDWVDRKVTVQREVELRYENFLNSIFYVSRIHRGHYTPWEEYGDKWDCSAYKLFRCATMSFDRLKLAGTLAARMGILGQIWVDSKGYYKTAMKSDHPWIRSQSGGIGPCYAMNEDPNINSPLTSEQELLFDARTHGARNWCDFMAKEIITAVNDIDIQSIWYDNVGSGNPGREYIIKTVKNSLGSKSPLFMVNTNYKKLRPELANIIDVAWVEWWTPDTISDIKTMYRQYLAWNRASADNPDYPEHISVFWSDLFPQQRGSVWSKQRVNNDHDQTHVFRQSLFEAVTTDPDIIGMVNYPRPLETRQFHNPQTFIKHRRTWGFLTLYNHYYNSKDIVNLPAHEFVKIQDVKASFDDSVWADTVHIVVCKRQATNQMIIHLFNYMGTTPGIYQKRPRPRYLSDLRISVKPLSKPSMLRMVSPDYDLYDKVVCPKVVSEQNGLINLSIPLDTYSMIIVSYE